MPINRVHRIVIDSYPTPDGLPFDQQPISHYESAVEHFANPNEPFDAPKWLEDIDLSERLYTGSDDWTEGPTTGATIIGYDHEPLLTVPVLRRVNFFSKGAAQARLDRLTEWGAVGRVESSEPIEWPAAPPVPLDGQLSIEDAA